MFAREHSTAHTERDSFAAETSAGEGRCGSVFSGQGVEQGLGLFEVSRVKPLSEPIIDLGEHLPGVLFLALVLPQPAQAHHRSQFQRLRLLLAGNLNGLVKIRFGFRLHVGAGCWVLGAWDFGL